MRFKILVTASCIALVSVFAAPAQAAGPTGCETGDPNCSAWCELIDRLPLVACNT